MKKSTTVATMANGLLKVLQRYTKGIRLVAVLTILFTVGVGSMWGAVVTVSLSDGEHDGTNITWTAADGNITITQSKGTSTTAVSSSYISAPRVYKGHILSFEAKDGCKIKQIDLKCNSTYYGNSMTAGTVVTNNNVTNNTSEVSRTWTTTSGGTHVVSSVSSDGLSAIYIQNVASANNVQLRLTSIVITYVEESSIPANPYTVTLKDDESTLQQTTAGEVVVLPSRDGCDGYEFVGWTKSWSVAQTTWTTTAPIIINAGSYTPTADVNLYPVYTKTETTPGTTTTTTDYVLTDLANIKSTDVVVITSKNSSGSYYAMSNNNGTSSAPAATKITVSSSKLSSAPDDKFKWNISNNSGTLTIYPNGTTSTWLYCTSTNNGVRVGTNTAKAFTIDATSGYLKHTGTSRYIGVYNNADWRCYTSTSTNIGSQTLAFFVETTTTTTTSTTTTSYISVPDCATQTANSLLPKYRLKVPSCGEW